MARIAGVDLPKEKRIEIGLTYVYGIGRKSANDILAKAGVNPDTRVKDLTDEEEAKIREVIDHGYVVEGDLRRLLPWHTSPQGSPLPRSEDKDQRQNSQGSQEDYCKQEEVITERWYINGSNQGQAGCTQTP